ncbi:MAG: hypothetical protein ABSG64_04895 [Solirubrobacteraceae bacterium]
MTIASPNPDTDAQSGFEGFARISCPSVSFCVAIDGPNGDVQTSTDPTGGAGAWHVADVDGTTHLSAVSCPSSALCVATDQAGDVVTSTNPTGGAGAWKVEHIDGSIELFDVSCASSTLCVATDQGGDVLTTRSPAIADDWTVTPLGHSLWGVACPSISLCVVSSGAGPGKPEGVETTTNPLYATSAWTFTTLTPASATGVPLSVACPTVSLCVLADNYGNTLTATNPTGGAGAWSAFYNPVVDPGPTDVSCASVALCVISSGLPFASTDPAGGGSAWSTSPVPAGFIAQGVSCPSVSLCVAVGGGEVSFGTPATTLTTPPSITMLHLKIHLKADTATFTFRASAAASRFECSLARGAKQLKPGWAACKSPRTTGRLAARVTYSFYVRAIAVDGHAGPARHRAFAIH